VRTIYRWLAYFANGGQNSLLAKAIWAHVKRKVSCKLVTDKANMKSLALGALRSIQKLPNMVKSFFRQPEFQYIAM